MAPLKSLASTLLLASLFTGSVSAAPVASGESTPLIQYFPASTVTPPLLRRLDKNDFLRILPLGASITQGSGSTTGNGYRKPLRDQLRFAGWKVNMVGTKKDGSMVDRVSPLSLPIIV